MVRDRTQVVTRFSGSETYPASCKMSACSLLREQSGSSVALITHTFLGSGSSMGRAIPRPSLCACLARKETIFIFDMTKGEPSSNLQKMCLLANVLERQRCKFLPDIDAVSLHLHTSSGYIHLPAFCKTLIYVIYQKTRSHIPQDSRHILTLHL